MGDGSGPRPAYGAAETLPRFLAFLACATILVGLAPQTSDIAQTRARELAGGPELEYPALTRTLYAAERSVAPSPRAMGLLNAAVAVAAAAAVAALLRRDGRGEALWMGAPTLILAAVNVDAVSALLILLAIRAWRLGRAAEAGAWAGLGAAFKVSPGVVLLPLLAASGRRPGARMALVAAAAWAAANLPDAIGDPASWRYPYEFAARRDDVRGTIWAASGLRGAALNRASLALFAALASAVALAVHRRRLGAEAGCALTLLAYLAANKVWQPHYLLWVLPALALAGAPARPVRAFELANLACFLVLWYDWDPASRVPAHRWLAAVGAARLAAVAWVAWALIRARDRGDSTGPGG